MSDDKPIKFLGGEVVMRAYAPMLEEFVEQWNRQARMDWELLPPDERYKRYQEAMTKRFEAEAKVRRFINEKHNKTQTLRSLRKRYEALKARLGESD